MVRKVLVAAFCVLMLLPLWFLFTGSIQSIKGLMIMPAPIFPANPTLANYSWLVQIPELVRWVFNTGFITLSVVLGSTLVSAMAGYAFAFYNFKGKKLLWMLLMLGLMIPSISKIIPLFVITNQLGIAGTQLSAIMPLIFAPTLIFLARNYFETVPKSLLEAARIDGANDWQILFRIILPISQPIVGCIALFSAISALGDFVWQQLQLQDNQVATLLVGLMRMVQNKNADGMGINPIGKAMMVGVVLMVPLLIIFSVANKYFTNSLSGAMKE
jgi:ABC-type glycerol-3-phosphate transport system permease component